LLEAEREPIMEAVEVQEDIVQTLLENLQAVELQQKDQKL
jgi:hypothetical protein